MNSSDLQKLAEYSRSMREAGVSLLLLCGILVFFFLVSFASENTPSNTNPVSLASDQLTAPDPFAEIQLEAKAAVVYDVATDQITDMPIDEWCAFVDGEKFGNIPLLGGVS